MEITFYLLNILAILIYSLWLFLLQKVHVWYENGAPQTAILKYDWISLWKITLRWKKLATIVSGQKYNSSVHCCNLNTFGDKFSLNFKIIEESLVTINKTNLNI